MQEQEEQSRIRSGRRMKNEGELNGTRLRHDLPLLLLLLLVLFQPHCCISATSTAHCQHTRQTDENEIANACKKKLNALGRREMHRATATAETAF